MKKAAAGASEYLDRDDEPSAPEVVVANADLPSAPSISFDEGEPEEWAPGIPSATGRRDGGGVNGDNNRLGVEGGGGGGGGSSFRGADAGLGPERSARESQEEEQDAEEFECPICFESINPRQAAMRCSGQGGRCHYFHAHCLSRWVMSSQARNAHTAPTCPVCRGPVQVHKRRLQAFLNSAHAQEARGGPGEGGAAAAAAAASAAETFGPAAAPSEGIEILRGIANSVGETVADGWSKIPVLSEIELTKENVIEGAGILAGASAGFFMGRGGVAPTTGSYFLDEAAIENTSTSVQVAYAVGWVAGVGWRWYWQLAEKERDDDDK